MNINFGEAIEALKQGKKVARINWNGKNMYLQLAPVGVATLKEEGDLDHTLVKTLPHIVMKTVDNEFIPWLASQTDILSEDWQVINN